jgi:hypothetical protein
MTKSRLTKKEQKELYDFRMVVFLNREAADAGDRNARAVVDQARENIARLTAKRDNRIWL